MKVENGNGDEVVVANTKGALFVDDFIDAKHACAFAKVVGFEGELVHDRSKPDGTPRKIMDDTNLKQSGWEPSISLEAGLNDAYGWFKAHLDNLRES